MDLPLKTDLEITAEELMPRSPRVAEPEPPALIELRAIHMELKKIDHAMNVLIPRVRAAAKALTDDVADVRMRDILAQTANHFRITELSIMSQRRDREVVRVRQIAMYLCKVLTPRSFADIGLFFRDRDHSTVMHAIDSVEALKTTDSMVANAIAAISAKIKDNHNV